MSEYENLRDEFEHFMRTQHEACEIENEEEEQDYPYFVLELTTKMMAPAQVGVYFSKKDIREIGRAVDEMIALKPREWMLKNLLSSIITPDDMHTLFETIKTFIDLKIATYDELSDTFDSSAPFFEEHRKKALKLKKRLDTIYSEFKEEYQPV